MAFADVQHEDDVKTLCGVIDLASVQGHDLANPILGKRSEEVCAEIPQQFQILHIESLVRRARFLRSQTNIRTDLRELPLNVFEGELVRYSNEIGQVGSRTGHTDRPSYHS